MNIIDEINTLIKKYAPRPYFTSQEHLEDIIQNESLAEVRADFVMDEWVIGHITDIIEKYQEPKTGKWIPVGYDGYADGYPVIDEWECSECGWEHYGDSATLTNYCSYCGAKMVVSE